ncbi:MAG: ABC transporter ATP-binding protein [Clostridia bacterium]|nr:ABC transporter ATP-binding protein [Clostridia bacterium]
MSIFRYLKSYRKEAVLAPFFKLLEASFELIVPLVVAQIVDVGIADGNMPYVMKMFLVLVLFGIVGLAFSVTAQYFSAKAAVGFAVKLRHELFQKIQSFSYRELDEIGTGTLITRMTADVNQVQTGVNLFLRLLLRSPFIVFGAMIMAFTVDVQAALVFVVAIPLLFVIVFAVMLVSIPLFKKVQGKLDTVLNRTKDNLTGVRVIRAFRKEQREIEEFDESNESLKKSQLFVGRISAILNPLTYVIVNVAIVLLIHVGAIRVEIGLLTQGGVMALYNYMTQILVELVKFANMIITVNKALASKKRIESVLTTENTLQQIEGEQKEEDFIVFDHVSLTYHGAGAPALSDICFTVKRGETVGVIGGTGSGKTSLVNLIPHFYDCTEGSVRIDGSDVKAYDPKALRERIGIVPQKAVLFRGTIRENLLWGNENATEEELALAVHRAQADDVIKSKEKGLDDEVAQGGKNLSGGQRQRLTIARALVKNPDILILDDSASALDYATEAQLRKELKQLPCTKFIVSQRTGSIAHADKIIVLSDGKQVGFGTHEQLLSSCEVYREIYESQFKKEDSDET